MSKPSNWYDMSDSERRAWQRAENERSDLEQEKEEATRRAERADADARRAQEAAKAARYEYEDNAEAMRGEIEDLHELLSEARVERDETKSLAAVLLAALVEAEYTMRTHIMPEHWDGYAAKAAELARAAIERGKADGGSPPAAN